MDREYKQYDMLSSYAISEDGEVIELDTLDVVDLVHDPVRKEIMNYKLLTDEQVQLTTKTIKLWRRFTVDDVKKMYKSDRAKPISLDVDIDEAMPVLKDWGVQLPLGVQDLPKLSIPYHGTSSVQVDNSGTQVECTSDEIVQVKQGKSVQVCISGTVYKSVNEASAQLSIHRNTVKKRLDDPLNSDYTYID